VDPSHDEPIQILILLITLNRIFSLSLWTGGETLPVVFKNGYGIRRFVQEQFYKQQCSREAVLELNSLDAFRGGGKSNLVALLPPGAILEAETTQR